MTLSSSNRHEKPCRHHFVIFSAGVRHTLRAAAHRAVADCVRDDLPSAVMNVLAVLLAAGGGTRFTGPTHKLDATMGDGRSVYAHAVEQLSRSGAAHLAVVHGTEARDVPAGVRSLMNARWAEGQATSMAVAVEAARELGVDALVVGLADQPFVPASAWRQIITAPPHWPIVVATYAGRRGPHPVRLAQPVWPLLPPIGDDGARSVLREHADWVLEVPCDGSADDIDTVEDLARWTSS
jgi:CTP:molybdopterin cytidylyltransferase MocA